jgi:hypothetical protein
MDGKRWVVMGMLAALLLAAGPAMGTALAQESDESEMIATVAAPGHLCDSDGWCYPLDGKGFILPSDGGLPTAEGD